MDIILRAPPPPPPDPAAPTCSEAKENTGKDSSLLSCRKRCKHQHISHFQDKGGAEFQAKKENGTGTKHCKYRCKGHSNARFCLFCRRAGSTVNADTKATSPKSSFKLRCAETRVSARRPEIDTPVAGKQGGQGRATPGAGSPLLFFGFLYSLEGLIPSVLCKVLLMR